MHYTRAKIFLCSQKSKRTSGNELMRHFNIFLDLLMHRRHSKPFKVKKTRQRIRKLSVSIRIACRVSFPGLKDSNCPVRDEIELTTVWARQFSTSLTRRRGFKRRALIASLSFHLFFNSIYSTSFFQKSRRNREIVHSPFFTTLSPKTVERDAVTSGTWQLSELTIDSRSDASKMMVACVVIILLRRCEQTPHPKIRCDTVSRFPTRLLPPELHCCLFIFHAWRMLESQ